MDVNRYQQDLAALGAESSALAAEVWSGIDRRFRQWVFADLDARAWNGLSEALRPMSPMLEHRRSDFPECHIQTRNPGADAEFAQIYKLRQLAER